MSKLTYEDKINIYITKQNGMSTIPLSNKQKTLDELIPAIDDYINYYNYDRIKAKLKGLSPVNYRLQSSNQKLFINCPIFGVQFIKGLFI